MIKLKTNSSVYVIITKSNAITNFAIMIEYWPLIHEAVNFKIEYVFRNMGLLGSMFLLLWTLGQ